MIKEKLSHQMKDALKAQDKLTLSFARNLHAAIRKVEVDERLDLDDAGVIKIIVSLLKQRQDSLVQFKKGNREDLAAKEQAEIIFLQSYLPEPLEEKVIAQMIDDVILQTGAKTKKELSLIIKTLQPKILGRFDSKRLVEMITEKLL